jgi:hypothetical protein
MGTDSYGEIQWKCESQLTNAKLGKLSVTCEGYQYPDDPYILKGSCGLEYELDLINSDSYNSNTQSNYYNSYPRHSSHTSGILNQTFSHIYFSKVELPYFQL